MERNTMSVWISIYSHQLLHHQIEYQPRTEVKPIASGISYVHCYLPYLFRSETKVLEFEILL